MSPFARRPSASIANPDASTVRSVSRFGWHPPLTRVQTGCARSWNRAFHGLGETGRARACAAAPRGRARVLRFSLSTTKGTGTVLSVWIVRHGEDFPRLTTCYIV